MRVGNKGGVTINSAIPEVGRRRFALAHELGHWLLHEDRTQLFLCTQENLRDYDASAEEIEANAFAAALLLPMSMMLPERTQAAPSLAVIAAIVARFNVTLMAAALRTVSKFGQPVMVVFSREGRVTWWRRSDESESMNGLYCAKAQALSPRSCASTVAETGESGGDMQPVEWDGWFPHFARRSGRTLHEQSVRLDHAPIVMTLLWAPAAGEVDGAGNLRTES